MKALLILSLMASCSAFADVRTVERVVSDNTSPVVLTMNDQTVRCSDRGYGNLQLKISVPDLADLAVFNHVNYGETLPCITAGRCENGNMPADILNAGGATENVNVRVQRVEVYDIDDSSHACTRRLEERVSATIRGKQFLHLRQADLAELSYALCAQI